MNESTKSTHDYSWEDPAPHVQGVLLSDAICFYIEKANLIENWVPSSLKPASYGLRLGSRYYCNGKFGNLKEGGKLILPRNSITYVSMLEKINIPLYMIARFNLKIDLIYQGIILGTGPQVDPGFRGHLSCPLHNISNNDVELEYGDRFATIDFIKTSKFPSPQELPDLNGLTTKQLYERYWREGIPGYHGKQVVLFSSDKLERKKLDDYLPVGTFVQSSLKDFEETIKGTKKFNIQVAIALASVLVALTFGGTGIWWYQYTYFRDLHNRLEQLIARDANLTESRDSLQKKLSELESKASRLESEMKNFVKKK